LAFYRKIEAHEECDQSQKEGKANGHLAQPEQPYNLTVHTGLYMCLDH